MPVNLDPLVATQLLAGMADFSLVVDSHGKVLEADFSNDDLSGTVGADWVGAELGGLVTPDSRDRTSGLLEQAASSPGNPVSEDITHLLPDGAEMLVRYHAVCPAQGADVLAFGRDMRPVANLRQQLMNAQQALEQEYWRLRQIETRYRRLFDMVGDGIIVVEGDSGRVLEANPEANRLLAGENQSIVGKPFPTGMDEDGLLAVNRLMADARSVGKAKVQGVQSNDGSQLYQVYASFLRQDDESRYLLRVSPAAGAGAGADSGGDEHLMEDVLLRAPDAILLTDDDGRLLAANRMFLDLAQLLSEEQAVGQSVDRWLGESGVDLSVLLTNLRRGNSVKLFSTTLHGQMGASTDVEISACNTADPGEQIYAFFIREIGRRIDSTHQADGQLPRSIEQISQRVGRVPLKELVRESTDVIEALCIEAALKLTHGNRASAAQLLGLSRQGLYAKLRRYGIGGGEVTEAEVK